MILGGADCENKFTFAMPTRCLVVLLAATLPAHGDKSSSAPTKQIGIFDGIGLWGYCREGLGHLPFKEHGKEGGCQGVAAANPVPELVKHTPMGDLINAGMYGEWDWPLPSARIRAQSTGFSYTADADAVDRIVMRDCIEACIGCSRCRVISVSRKEKDCSWYAQCNTSRLGDAFQTSHRSFRVRGDDGSVTADALAMVAQPTPYAPSRTGCRHSVWIYCSHK